MEGELINGFDEIMTHIKNQEARIRQLEEEKREREREYQKEYRKKNKEKNILYQQEYRENNKEKNTLYQQEYYKKNKDKLDDKSKEYMKEFIKTPAGKKSNRIYNWKSYGIICDNFDALYERYLNTEFCEECKCKLTEDKTRTSTTRCLDHNHKTGEFRNILCHACNIKRG